ncbi:GNAT family N-acetyltransferase [Sporosarcina sp. ACRSL]|uniref:GNAT family N-acetyltransferase n=1 Tax=Sporosarcina sp. ACRSL TaxID=2918215 RepID=UPI001EF4DC53|nr:GNAT family N-acetyltransferase [Sporosarcina sp. ACRSL]MCG7344206.1 GNAT family N-acetyltransferase [Sporosarcina sp. ACRSL]
MKVVPISEINVSDIVKLWNEEIGERFPMSTALWHQNTTEEPNVLKEGSLAVIEEGELRGLIVAKRYVEKLDARMQATIGWIQCMLVRTSSRNEGIGSELLRLAEQALIAAGVEEIRLGRDPWHYFPGIPLEDEDTINWFEKHGYVKGGVETDLIKDVRDGELYKLTNSSEHYRLLTTEDIPSLLSFLERVFPGRWHYEAIHYEMIGGTGREFIGFFMEDELQGFCRINDSQSPVIAQNVYWSALVKGEMGGMGPLGIDRDIRGKHFGLDLVKAAANELINRGVTDIVIDWTQLVSFYGKLGFQPWKQYQSMAKTIGVGQ